MRSGNGTDQKASSSGEPFREDHPIYRKWRIGIHSDRERQK